MMPYSSYQLYQAERAKTAAEIRRADRQLGEISRTLSSAWHHVSRPTYALLAVLRRRGPWIRARQAMDAAQAGR
jgi:hypothetical protein